MRGYGRVWLILLATSPLALSRFVALARLLVTLERGDARATKSRWLSSYDNE
jgi:hypothetical protein